MITIQSLRRSRGITLTDLALLSGVPARSIAAIEYGVQTLDHRTREQIAHVFGVPAHSLLPGAPPALQQEMRRRLAAEARMLAPVVGLAIASAAILAPALRPAAASTPQVVVQVAQQPAAASRAQPMAGPTVAPLVSGLAALPDSPSIAAIWPTSAPALAPGAAQIVGGAKADRGARADGTPYGCPVETASRVVVTQGYGVGSHAPAAVWGALDLAVDGDGDGYAEVDATRGVLVFAPNGGTARVALGSWPGGNYVRVTDARTGWATAYAHLDQVFVADGQTLEPGTPIGTIGTTGQSTGPHLHYEVWRGGVNVDPTPYVSC